MVAAVGPLGLEIPSHAAERLVQRGVTEAEVERVLRDGWPAPDAAPGSLGKTLVLPFEAYRKGKWFEQKEVTVHWTEVSGRRVLLTVKSRFGSGFSRQQ